MGRDGRAEKAFENYRSLLLGAGDVGIEAVSSLERDDRTYDMSQRLKLADRVAADGHDVVADLGSRFGGMSHALKECGVRVVVSTEYSHTAKDIKKVNDDVVRCDSFRLPLRNLDALVSYMFLGRYLPGQLLRTRTMRDIFGELSESAETIYSVELASEYHEWLNENYYHHSKTPEQLEKKMRAALPDFEVEFLGEFGKYAGYASKRDTLLPDFPAPSAIDRLGFKFTKKNASSSSAVWGKELVYRILSLFGRSKK